MDTESLTYEAALALLAWQVELGVSDAVSDEPLDRYALGRREKTAPAASGPAAQGIPAEAAEADPVAEARAAAGAAQDVEGLRAALAAFELCELKKGARNTVFADGMPGARVMIVGDAPGRDEDREGRPFAGPAGQLLDRMLAAIGLDRASGVYLTCVVPWRPTRDREPTADEIAMLRPFLERHVALAAPDLLVAMGNSACLGLIGRRGISRLRGRWDEALGLPVLPMLDPAQLLRAPAAKREAWSDLLELKLRLEAGA